MIRNLSTFFLVLGFSFIISFYYPHLTVAPGSVQEYHKKYENECSKCHLPFSGVPNRSCEACHETIKNNNFLKARKSSSVKVTVKNLHNELGGTLCYKCHPEHESSEINQRYRFFHDLDQITGNCSNCHFSPQDKIHENTKNCLKCHTVKTWKGGKFFHEAGQKNCENCHKKPNDSFHKSLGSGCESCHNNRNWREADFDHSKFFELRGPHKAKCETCHKSGSYSDFTCYGCHEHNQTEVKREHSNMGVPIEKCTDCHRDASESNAKRLLREIWRKSDGTTTATPRGKNKYRDQDEDHHREHDDDDEHEEEDDD